MAKRVRRKAKRGKATFKQRPTPRILEKRATATRYHQPITEVHVLGIAGGIITLLAGILWLIGSLLSWNLAAFSWFSFGDYGIVNIVCGLIILITAATLKKNFLRAGSILIVFAIIAIIAPPAGFVVGPVLAMIGAIIAFVKSANPVYG